MQRNVFFTAIGFLVASVFLMVNPLQARASAVSAIPDSSLQQRPVLGISVVDILFSRLEELELPYGVKVVGVQSGSSAEGAGVQPGDIILEVDDQPVYSPQRLRWLWKHPRENGKVALKLYRNGATTRVEIEAPRRHPPAYGQHPLGQPPSRASGSYLGIQMQPMTDELRQAFGAQPGVGILVVEVAKDSPAAKAGLAAGDVLMRMDRKAIRRIPDVYRVLDYFDPGEVIEVEIRRQKRSEVVSVTLGKGDSQDIRRRGTHWPNVPGEQIPPFPFPGKWFQQLEQYFEEWLDDWDRQWDGGEQIMEKTMRGARKGAINPGVTGFAIGQSHAASSARNMPILRPCFPANPPAPVG